MTIVRVEGLQNLLKGLAEGSIEIVLRAASGKGSTRKAGAKKAPKAPKIKAPKPARKLKAKAKPAKKLGIRAQKATLPEPRQIFLFLRDKQAGVKLTPLARQFSVKRSILRPLLDKLVTEKDIEIYNGAYFLRRRLRKVDGPVQEKRPAITAQAILAALGELPGATLMDLALSMGEKNYQRLIKPMNALKNKGLVLLDGKAYRLP